MPGSYFLHQRVMLNNNYKNMLEDLASIRVIKACKSFNPKHMALIANNLTIESGPCMGLLGASDSGKYTLQRSMCGLARLDGLSSHIQIWGKRLQKSEKLSRGVRQMGTRIDSNFLGSTT